MLSPREKRTLAAICDALLPSMRPGPGDDPQLFAASARSVGVPEAMEQALEMVDPSSRTQFRLLLRVLELRPIVALLIGRARPFSRLSQKGRERLLWALATSHIPQLRTAFQGLKRLICQMDLALIRHVEGSKNVKKGALARS